MSNLSKKIKGVLIIGIVAANSGKYRYLGMLQRQNTEMQTKADQKAMDLRRSDLQLLNAQKRVTVVNLAGGVAQQYNNILSVLGGGFDLMRLEIAREKVIQWIY